MNALSRLTQNGPVGVNDTPHAFTSVASCTVAGTEESLETKATGTYWLVAREITTNKRATESI
jgi:hypothetical protein